MEKLMVYLIAFTAFLGRANAQMKSGDNVVVSEKSNGDVYLAGGTVTISSPVNGDLIAAGGTITINDSVSQDVLIAGGNIFVNGFVNDDIRCAGGQIRISKNVTGDLVVTGGAITIDKDVLIAGNLLVSGGEVVIDGNVNGDIKSASGTLTLNGNAHKSIDCRGGKLTINGNVLGNATLAGNQIEIGSNASFNKAVKYWNDKGSADFHGSVKNGTATFDPSLEVETGKWHYLGFASFLMVIWYLGMAFLFIGLIQYFFGRTFRNAAGYIRNSSLKSLGLGLLFFTGVPLAIIISFVTVIGIPIGILSIIAFVTLIMLGTVIASVLIGNWINDTYNKSWSSGKVVLASFGIFICLKLASLTPVVGPLIMFLIICMGFGGILMNIKWKSDSKLALT